MSHASPITSFAAAQAFLLDRIDYERAPFIPYQERHLKLQRMRELLARLGDPQRQVATLHVAGTKGKGSTSALLTSMLVACGYRVGTYTSPHFQSVVERLALQGAPCSETRFTDLVREVYPAVLAMDTSADPDNRPTFFEILTALGFVLFSQERVDVAVVEVGLGGRLDSTNTCEPTACIITSISLDHTVQLGNDLASIAAEKAGIIKPGVPVVTGVRDTSAYAVIADTARRAGSRLLSLGADFECDYRPPRMGVQSMPSICYRQSFAAPPAVRGPLPLAMWGRHQAENAALALATIDVLREQEWRFSEADLARGLATARCGGRIEVLGQQPTIILDTAHNGASVRALLDVLDEPFPESRIVFVFGTTRGKDVAGMLRQFVNRRDQLVLTSYRNNPRSYAASQLARQLQILLDENPSAVSPLRYEVVEPSHSAWQRARELVEPGGVICVTGSFFLAAELEPLARHAATQRKASEMTGPST